MSGAFEALGPLYAKLGLATAADLINARKAAAEAGYGAFKREHLAGVLRGALGLAITGDAAPVLAAMRAKDPTLDVQPSDREMALLLGAVASAEMEERTALGGLTALGLVTASFGGIRQSPVWPDLVAQADKCLANMQLAAGGQARNLVAGKRPEDVTAALDAMTIQQQGYGPTLAPQPAMSAIKKVADYAESAHTAAATQANAVLAYARRLEEELRTYWWVVGGWSDDLRKPYSGLTIAEASIRAGAGLAGKTTLPLGLFAGPALLDKQIRNERKGRLTKLSLADAVGAVDAGWRARFKPAATTHGDLLPATLALNLSADAGDEEWRGRFRRTVGVPADASLMPLDLALQVQREVLLARALPGAA